MLVNGATVGQISATLAQAFANSVKILGFDLNALHRVLEYHPEDMTVTVETGITLGHLQRTLSEHGQWLPIDPANPDAVTIDQIIQRNLSGPRRYGHGTIREHLIGLKAVLADGRVIQNGGKVVKNVAGFDLCKLFVGSQWSLGAVVEATFRLRPLPAQEIFLAQSFDNIALGANIVQRVIDSDLTPIVIDLHSTQLPKCSCAIGLAGTVEEVQWQREKASALGFSASTTLDCEAQFWASTEPWQWTSVLPSEIGREIEARSPRSFVARAGNGTIFYRGGSAPKRLPSAKVLNQRLKETFDPKNILPELNDK